MVSKCLLDHSQLGGYSRLCMITTLVIAAPTTASIGVNAFAAWKPELNEEVYNWRF